MSERKKFTIDDLIFCKRKLDSIPISGSNIQAVVYEKLQQAIAGYKLQDDLLYHERIEFNRSSSNVNEVDIEGYGTLRIQYRTVILSYEIPTSLGQYYFENIKRTEEIRVIEGLDFRSNSYTTV